MVCLDISKAYDTVWRKRMISKLSDDFNVPAHMCTIIDNIYTDTHAFVSPKYGHSTPFQTFNGVLQGSVLSPLLYSVFMNDLITQLHQSDCGPSVLGQKYPSCHFADDIILLAGLTSPCRTRRLLFRNCLDFEEGCLVNDRVG